MLLCVILEQIYDEISSNSKFSSTNFHTISATIVQINNNIKKARELKGYSQAKIASLLGEKRSTYAEWERSTVPKADILMKIAEVTGVPMGVLLDEKPSNGAEQGAKPSEVILTGAHVTLQDHIDLLKDYNNKLFALLNSNLGTLLDKQETAIAYQKAWVHYEAEKASGGDPGKKEEIMNKMRIILDEQKFGGALSGNQSETGKHRKE